LAYLQDPCGGRVLASALPARASRGRAARQVRAARAPENDVRDLLLPREFLRTSRGRIVHLLRRGPETVDRIAATLNVTANAVRAQLAAMERDGLVRRSGRRPGATRPFQLFELTPQLEQLMSGAYVPFLTHVVRLVSEREPRARVEKLMRQAGHALAVELPARGVRSGSLQNRLNAASDLLNEELGAVTHVTRADGHFVIRGEGCPLAALTEHHPGVCLAIETLLADLLDGPDVRQCCGRDGKPRCCFEVWPRRKARR
jgi:predicted ArsR family transcriptional regulator